jgi:hypothetical protein
MTEYEVRCNMCEWEGYEEDLELIEEESDNDFDRSFFRACPNCKTDDYLMDLLNED